MKKLIPLAIVLGLMMPVVYAQKKTEPAKEKPTATETKQSDKKAKESAAEKKTEPKPGELSDSDKELMAAAKKEADALTPAQRTKLMDLLNKGDAGQLEAVEGIGEVRAKNIIAKRPFKKPEDAAMVDGIGIETFKNLVAAAKPAPKTDAKKTEKATEKSAKPGTAPTKDNPAPSKKPS